MTLPQNVKDAVRSIDDSETVAATPHPDCNALVKIISVDDWQTIRAHLMIQDAEIERLQSGISKHVDRVCELQSRLAAANALLRECHGFLVLKGIDLRLMGDPLSLIENIETHLQGAGDEGGRPA